MGELTYYAFIRFLFVLFGSVWRVISIIRHIPIISNLETLFVAETSSFRAGGGGGLVFVHRTSSFRAAELVHSNATRARVTRTATRLTRVMRAKKLVIF